MISVGYDYQVEVPLSPRRYKRSDEFPHESFVQRSVERHFRDLGFLLDVSGHVDLMCSHPATGEQWHIEVKGVTKATGLDFRTGLGQLLQRMSNEAANHGLAVPNHKQFVDQTSKVSQWVIDRLALHWLLVDPDGSVTVIPPNRAADPRGVTRPTA